MEMTGNAIKINCNKLRLPVATPANATKITSDCNNIAYRAANISAFHKAKIIRMINFRKKRSFPLEHFRMEAIPTISYFLSH